MAQLSGKPLKGGKNNGKTLTPDELFIVSDLLYTNTLEGNMKESLVQRVYWFHIDCFIKYRIFI